MALQAGQAIGPASGLQFSGNYNGKPLNLTVTKAGTLAGTYSQGPFQVTRITINGTTYLNAPAGYWNLQTNIPGGASTVAAGKWAKTPSDDVTSFATLTPGGIANVLEHVGSKPSYVNTTLGHTSVIKLTDNEVTYFITTSSPNRLMQMDGSIEGDNYVLQPTALTAKTIAPAFSTMHSDVQDLLGAVDPEAEISQVGNGTLGSNCNNDSECTVTTKATVSDSGSQTVLIQLTAKFSGTKGGTPFGTCSDTVAANTAFSSTAVSVTLACTLGGATWQGWFDSHTGQFELWVETLPLPTVNSASDIASLQSALNQQQG
jgi:hypothetical protein